MIAALAGAVLCASAIYLSPYMLKSQQAQGAYEASSFDSPSFIRIHMESVAYIDAGKTSGSAVSVAKGLFLGAYHVVNEGSTLTPTLSLKNGRQAKGAVIWFDETLDLMLIAADLDAPVARLRKTLPEVGERVVGMGSPVGFQFLSVWGHVTSELNPSPDGDSQAEFLLDLNILNGDSGGPTFDVNGDVIGLMDELLYTNVSEVTLADGTVFTDTANTGLGYVVASAVFYRTIETQIENYRHQK